jgi:hypothetical protein
MVFQSRFDLLGLYANVLLRHRRRRVLQQLLHQDHIVLVIDVNLRREKLPEAVRRYALVPQMITDFL